MKYPAYPKYKDSGVEWLGEVPEHWELSRFSKKVFIAEGQVNPEESPYLDMFLIAPNYIESGTGRLLSKETAAEQGAESGKYFCMNGDVIYSKIRPSLAKVVMASEDCLCSADMYPLRGKGGVCNKFIYWVLLSRWFIAWSVLESDRVAMPKINRESLNSCLLCLPSLPEQQGIATFLDAQTSKLDALIAKKRELIAKLQEKRAALITRTVTRGLPPEAAKAAGLDPHPKMKDSGVEWLGEVPEHWEIKRLKYLSPGITVGIVIEPSKYYEESGIPCLRSLNVKQNFLEYNNLVYISAESNILLSKSMLHKGDLVIVRTGQPGTTAVIDEKFDKSNCIDLIIVRQSRCQSGHFLSYFLNSKQGQIQFCEGSGGAIQQHFNISIASNLIIAAPPLAEQVSIVDYLNSEVAKIDALLKATESAIERLQEYRSALITAAVTGKIDVRNIPPEAA
ncbi:MAG: restriction endonuclease subunit S [Solidesulfovibrio sp.]|uniref:restriction endonuclease subunit S n=1 Tax=Solidesulfovibrio sp. TaxID=2910990 RepID=UPI002B21B2C8|nr:restriction endonuclease subunit S [Solidesulfovibrio sp.]MEA4856551.1 restriction endonuclease subunit S [Solidesulfovibrio sp.]